MPVEVSQPLRLNYLQYILHSKNQHYPTSVRILIPDDLASIENRRVVYVLPTNPDVSVRWNDGLDTFLSLNLHNRYGFIAVAPSFTDWPWYANHPEDPTLQQESYLLEDVLPLIDSLYPNATRLLLGFSKAGTGAFQLLLRHSALFHALAAWDVPLMKTQPDQFEMPLIYGTQANFNQYMIPNLLKLRAGELRERTRIALFGYANFGENPPEWSQNHVAEGHMLMLQLGIPHFYDNSTWREHRWDSGWMQQAVAALDAMSSPEKTSLLNSEFHWKGTS